jgi:hypothetical protein
MPVEMGGMYQRQARAPEIRRDHTQKYLQESSEFEEPADLKKSGWRLRLQELLPTTSLFDT